MKYPSLINKYLLLDPRPFKIYVKIPPRTLRHSETEQAVHVDVAVVGAEKLRLLLQIVQDPIQKTVPRIHHEARGPEPTEGDK